MDTGSLFIEPLNGGGESRDPLHGSSAPRDAHAQRSQTPEVDEYFINEEASDIRTEYGGGG